MEDKSWKQPLKGATGGMYWTGGVLTGTSNYKASNRLLCGFWYFCLSAYLNQFRVISDEMLWWLAKLVCLPHLKSAKLMAVLSKHCFLSDVYPPPAPTIFFPLLFSFFSSILEGCLSVFTFQAWAISNWQFIFCIPWASVYSVLIWFDWFCGLACYVFIVMQVFGRLILQGSFLL